MGRPETDEAPFFVPTARSMPAARPVTAPAGDPSQDRLRPLVFSTASYPAPEQFEVWQERCGPVISLDPVQRRPDGFVARNEIWDLGSMVLSSVVAPAALFARSTAELRRAAIDHWVIAYTRSGTTTTRTGDDVTVAGPGVPYVWSFGRPFDGVRSDLDWTALFLPRDRFSDFAGRLDAAHGTTLDTPTGFLLVDFLGVLERRLPTLTAAEMPSVEQAIRAMLGVSLPQADASASGVPDLDIARRERVRRLIQANLASATLGPRSLCRMAGLSRSTLYRLFDALGGVAAYIQRQRLRAAHEVLCSPDDTRPIHAIAEACGFADASVFSRAFRQAFGCSPRDARVAAASGAPPPSAIRLSASEPSDFVDLLRRL
jgi:AraC-like DNA-binding protein